jgi:hypothetical protein
MFLGGAALQRCGKGFILVAPLQFAEKSRLCSRFWVVQRFTAAINALTFNAGFSR